MRNGTSAVIIAKNEGTVIQRCIDSLHRLDEVVVLDTGSTDKTVEIARNAGATVVSPIKKPEGPFHFADARNEVMSYATNPWLLTIDADEVLEEGSWKAIRDATKIKDADGFFGTHLNHPPGDTKTVMPTPRLLLFRKDKWVWRWRIHERLKVKGDGSARVEKLKGLMIRHLPEAEGRETRRNQNLELLKLCVEESPEHRFALLQLGLELMFREDWKGAVDPLEKYVRGPCEGYLGQAAARMQLARTLARSGDWQRAMNEFVQARKEAPERREPLYWAATELIRGGYLPDAIWWLEEALKTPKAARPAFSLYSAQLQGTLIEDTLAECRRMMKEAEAQRAT